MRKLVFAVMAFILFTCVASAIPNSNEDGTYTVKLTSAVTELEESFSFSSKEAFNEFLDSYQLDKKVEAFDLECTFKGSAGVGRNYVEISVTGPCKEARAEFDAQMGSFEEEAGSWWDGVVEWWDSL